MSDSYAALMGEMEQAIEAERGVEDDAALRGLLMARRIITRHANEIADEITQAQYEALQLFVARKLHIEAGHHPDYLPPRCATCVMRGEIVVDALIDAGVVTSVPENLPEPQRDTRPGEKGWRWWPANPEEKV